MTKHIPLRMCVSCRHMRPQNELIRIVNNGGEIKIDRDKKMFGRGAYICPSEECVHKAEKKNLLAKHFRCHVSTDIYSEAEDMF